MSKAKHTAGKWSVSERTYENSKGAKYLTVNHLVNGSGVEGLAVVYEGCLGEDSIAEMEANARLIAEAPAMYEMLKSCLAFVDVLDLHGIVDNWSERPKLVELIKKIEG